MPLLVHVLAARYGCPNFLFRAYSSITANKNDITLQECFGFEQIVKATSQFNQVKHFLRRDGTAICLVAKTDICGRPRFAGLHKVGECPYCEYRNLDPDKVRRILAKIRGDVG